MENKIKEFIIKELTAFSSKIKNNNYNSPKYNNPFQPFDRSEITKCMSLGRSFDSQLGNRLQRICMFLARCKYGDVFVPSYIFIKSNEDKNIVANLFSYPQEFVDKYEIDAFQTQVVSKISNDDEILESILNLKVKNKIKKIYKEENGIKRIRQKDKDIIEEIINKYRSDFQKSIIKYKYTKCLSDNYSMKKNSVNIDLIYFKDCDHLVLYELKASGALDTKNRLGNANEVLNNKKIFSFIKNVESYFATYYNNCGESGTDIKEKNGVKFRGNMPNGPMFNIVSNEPKMNGKILVGSVFWENILPNGITHDSFIKTYVEAFKSTGIEKIINEI